MIKVAIVPVPTRTGSISYRAVAGERQSQGNTAGEALDALTTQLPKDAAGTLVVVQSFRPDRFFDQAHQQRLAKLMARWRAACDAGATLPVAEQSELETLIEEEVRASEHRTAPLPGELAR